MLKLQKDLLWEGWEVELHSCQGKLGYDLEEKMLKRQREAQSMHDFVIIANESSNEKNDS